MASVTGGKSPVTGPNLGTGFGSLNQLSTALSSHDARFSDATAKGRATKALALAMGGTEVYSKGANATDFFTRRGGTGNQMLGFGQFNLAYHRASTNSPSTYTKFMGDILTGKKPMPNAASRADFAGRLASAVQEGAVKNGADLQRWMRAQGFGGSNWQGIDDGWSRVPGLGDQLVRYIRGR